MQIFSACSRLVSCIKFKTLLVLLLAIILLPQTAFTANANQYDTPTGGEVDKALQEIPVGRFLPDYPLYFLISAKEALTRLFQPSAAKRSEFDFILAGKRLNESYLLIKKGKNTQAANNLAKYQKRLEKMTEQLEKARSQNQDIAKQVGTISNNLSYHQTLILALISANVLDIDSINSATTGFKNAVETVNKINPGVGNRFILLKDPEPKESNPQTEIEPSPTISRFPEVLSPSSSPRRIIY